MNDIKEKYRRMNEKYVKLEKRIAKLRERNDMLIIESNHIIEQLVDMNMYEIYVEI